MPLPLDREKTLKISEELEIAIGVHLLWFKELTRVLVCGRCDDAEIDADADAYLKTPFGDWYYKKANPALADLPAFQDMAGIQQAMHDSARQAMEEIKAGKNPSVQLHDDCIDHALNLNTRLRQLQLDIIGDLLGADSLTGCYTRRGMIVRLQAEQERALRLQRPCSLCLMDFDNFKKINDQYGHPAGDAVLKQGMRFVAGVLRKYDLVFRYGGEEFLLCLPGTPVEDAALVIDRIRSGLEKMPIMLLSKERIHVTASFGLADVMLNKPIEDSIARADEALFEAKQNGRNRVVVWQAG